MYFIWRLGDDFHEISQFFKFHFLIDSISSCKYCSIDLKRHLDYSGLRSNKSSLVSTFVTKMTEYLCSGWVFSSDKF